MYRNYDEIEKEYKDTRIPYSILLTSFEWKHFRDLIMREQGFICQICQQKPNYLAWELKSQYPNSNIYARPIENGTEYSCTHIVMHLHHKYYINNRLPWQYRKEVLQTLCAECHTEVHKNQVIMKYQTEILENPEPTTNCKKCLGTGYIDEYHYYQSGICFMCDGKGYSEK